MALWILMVLLISVILRSALHGDWFYVALAAVFFNLVTIRLSHFTPRRVRAFIYHALSISSMIVCGLEGWWLGLILLVLLSVVSDRHFQLDEVPVTVTPNT